MFYHLCYIHIYIEPLKKLFNANRCVKRYKLVQIR